MDNHHLHKPIELLSLEQEFQLQILGREIDGLTLEQAREYLRYAFRQIMVKENLCREMFKECYL
jgi:hypothetical protein